MTDRCLRKRVRPVVRLLVLGLALVLPHGRADAGTGIRDVATGHGHSFELLSISTAQDGFRSQEMLVRSAPWNPWIWLGRHLVEVPRRPVSPDELLFQLERLTAGVCPAGAGCVVDYTAPGRSASVTLERHRLRVASFGPGGSDQMVISFGGRNGASRITYHDSQGRFLDRDRVRGVLGRLPRPLFQQVLHVLGPPAGPERPGR